MKELVVGIVELDKQGRVNLGKVILKNVERVKFAYDFDNGRIYIKACSKEDTKIGGIFEWPTSKVDSGKRIIIPAWIRRLIEKDQTKHYGICFDGDYLVLTPVYDCDIERELPSIAIY